jgi:hypothetical protein
MDLSVVCEILQLIWSTPTTAPKEDVLTQINFYFGQPKEVIAVKFALERMGRRSRIRT